MTRLPKGPWWVTIIAVLIPPVRKAIEEIIRRLRGKQDELSRTVSDLAKALDSLSVRVTVLTWISAGAAVIAIAALLIALLR